MGLENGELQLEYEHLGVGGSTWIALEEKWLAHFAFEQGKAASYGTPKAAPVRKA